MNDGSWLDAWPCLTCTTYLHVFNVHKPQRETVVSARVSSKLQDEDGCLAGANKSTLKMTAIALIFRESLNSPGFPLYAPFIFVLLRLTFNFHMIERQDIPFAHCLRSPAKDSKSRSQFPQSGSQGTSS